MTFDPAVAPSYDKPLPGPAIDSAPARRPGSLRRTSHIDSTRVGTQGGGHIVALEGAARDLHTGDSDQEVRGEAALSITLGESGLIETVAHRPDGPSCQALIGTAVGFGFRSSVKNLLAGLSGTLLGLLVDDLSGAPAPARYGALRERRLSGQEHGPDIEGPIRAGRRNVCAGWRAAGIPFTKVMSGQPLPFEETPPVAPDMGAGDLMGWHPIKPLGPQQGRRVRRLDIWRQDGYFFVNAMFRDSATDPDLTTRVVHEYQIDAVLSDSLRVLEIRAEPRSLPFPTDCPWAAGSAQLIVGQSAGSLRETVRKLSAGPVSCTHLNDALRGLADVAVLAPYL